MEAAIDQFGLEDERNESISGGISRAWDGSAVPGVRLTISADPIESIESITVYLLEDGDARVATSHGYVIGSDTVSDVLQDPMAGSALCSVEEGMLFCDLTMVHGPEGSHVTTYGYWVGDDWQHDPAEGPVESRDEVGALYGDRVLNGARVSY